MKRVWSEHRGQWIEMVEDGEVFFGGVFGLTRPSFADAQPPAAALPPMTFVDNYGRVLATGHRPNDGGQSAYEARIRDAWKALPPAEGAPAAPAPVSDSMGLSASQRAYEERIANAWRR